MNFQKQASKAKAVYRNNQFKNEVTRVSEYKPSSDVSIFRASVRSGQLGASAKRAYAAKRGYDISVDPKTGKKQMFVRGTTFKYGGVEWLQNYLESPVGGIGSGTGAVASALSGRVRRQYSEFLTDVARKENVSVVYGHSRGAAVVNDMKLPGVRKIGLDGATILNRRSSITNIRQRQGFDSFIGLNAKKTVVVGKRMRPYNSKYHRVWS